MKTFIVIPAYNEAKTIAQVIEKLLNQNYDNIIVVNDGSSDETAEVVKNFPVHLINHAVNLGQGAALQTGNEYALEMGADAIVHFDADDQMKVDDIKKFLDGLQTGYQVVLGSRYLSGNNKIPFLKKYLIHKPGIWVNWLFTGLKLTDVHCGFRALTSSAASKIKIRQNNMAHASEINALIKKYGLSYKEVPVEVTYHKFGQGLRGGFKIIIDLIKPIFFDNI